MSRPNTNATLTAMSFGQELAVSGAAAGLAHVLHHPLYTLKSQMMFYGKEFSFRRFYDQMRVQKHDFLYRGLVSRSFGIMPEKAFKMQAWVMVGRWMDRHVETHTTSKWVLAGIAAGAATTIIGCPSERIMVLAQIRKQGFFRVLRQEGLFGLYDGFRVTLYRDIYFNVFLFCTREMIVSAYERHYNLSTDPWTRVLLGIPAGCIASVVSCPFDVVKTRVQGKELGSKVLPASKIMMDIVRKEGIRHLWKGLLPRLIAVPSMMSFFFVINEELEKFFFGTNGIRMN